MAQRFIDVEEVVGPSHSAQVLAMLQRVDKSVTADETAWCSAFVGYVAWLLGLPRSDSLSARSWLRVGEAVDPKDAREGGGNLSLQWSQNVPHASNVTLNAGSYLAIFGAE